MISRVQMETQLKTVFEPRQARVLSHVIADGHDDLVKAGDFRELKDVVQRLAEAQERTEKRMDTMAAGMDEMRKAIMTVNSQVGGISSTLGYALENEAYRLLPGYLRQHHQLEVSERFLRMSIGNNEINFLARARQADGREVLIVGESKSRLDERRREESELESVFAQLEKQGAAVAEVHPGVPIIPLLVTHFARPAFIQAAAERGVILVQSYQLQNPQ
jgi:hypothetical protein